MQVARTNCDEPILFDECDVIVVLVVVKLHCPTMSYLTNSTNLLIADRLQSITDGCVVFKTSFRRRQTQECRQMSSHCLSAAESNHQSRLIGWP